MPFSVARCEALMWLDAGLFFVVSRKAVLNGQAFLCGAPMRILTGSFHRRRAPNHVYNEP